MLRASDSRLPFGYKFATLSIRIYSVPRPMLIVYQVRWPEETGEAGVARSMNRLVEVTEADSNTPPESRGRV